MANIRVSGGHRIKSNKMKNIVKKTVKISFMSELFRYPYY